MMVHSYIFCVSLVLVCISQYYVAGNTFDEDITRLRKDMMSRVDILKATLKEMTQKRHLTAQAIHSRCNSSAMYYSLKEKMRGLMRKFMNISMELNLGTGKGQTDGRLGQRGAQSAERVVVSNYNDVIDHIKSLHSSLDDLETEMWKQDFNRVINERRLTKANRKMLSQTYTANLNRMALVGLDDTAGIIVAETEKGK